MHFIEICFKRFEKSDHSKGKSESLKKKKRAGGAVCMWGGGKRIKEEKEKKIMHTEVKQKKLKRSYIHLYKLRLVLLLSPLSLVLMQ